MFKMFDQWPNISYSNNMQPRTGPGSGWECTFKENSFLNFYFSYKLIMISTLGILKNGYWKMKKTQTLQLLMVGF